MKFKYALLEVLYSFTSAILAIFGALTDRVVAELDQWGSVVEVEGLEDVDGVVAAAPLSFLLLASAPAPQVYSVQLPHVSVFLLPV